jgi:hypothetical protein
MYDHIRLVNFFIRFVQFNFHLCLVLVSISA